MKKFYVLLLTLILLVSISAAAMADVDISGNLRVWYKTNVNAGTPDISSFEFDRLALKFSDALSDNNGFSSELRFGYRKDPTPSTLYVDLDNAYYYQKKLLTTDEFDAGFIAMYFYYNDQYTAITNGSLANKLCPYQNGFADNLDTTPSKDYGGGAVGIKYGVQFDGFQAALAVTNANDGNIKNSTTINGAEEAARIKIIPMEGLTIGVGYLNDVTDAACDSNKYLNVDGMYVFDPFKVFVEYDSETPNGKSAMGGEYVEGTMKLTDSCSVYIGGTLGCATSGLYQNSSVATDYYNGGFVFQIATKSALQFEYVSYSDFSSGNSFNVRLITNF